MFSREETLLAKGQSYLSVYARVDDQFREVFWRAVQELASVGYGADRSAGKGQFRLDGDLERDAALGRVERAGALLVLSTFQPGATDPTDGAWDAFTKYGKLGPEFGLENIFKRPLVMFKPGASFPAAHRPWLGRAIPMNDLLAPETAGTLRSRGVEVVHYAFGLGVPAVWPTQTSPISSEETKDP